MMEFKHIRKLRQGIEQAKGHCTPILYKRRGSSGLDLGQVQAWHLTPAKPCRGLVVFVHGAGNDGLFPQVQLFRALLAAGYEVFTFDLDGHGIRSNTWLAPETIDTAVVDALAVARQRQASAPLHLVGFSLGGALALAALVRQDVQVQSLCVIAAPHHLELTFWSMAQEMLSGTRPAFLRLLPTYGLYGILPAVGNFKRHTYPLRLAGRKGGLDYTHTLSAMFGQLDLLRLAPAIHTRTLLVYGRRDRIAPLAHGQDLQAALPQATLLILPGETHFTTLLSPRTASSLVNFLAKGAREVTSP